MRNSIGLTDANGRKYTLQFNRETVASMEDRNITPERVAEKPTNGIPLFFYWSFKMNHPRIKKEETDGLWSNLPAEGKQKVLERLIELWTDAQDTLMAEPKEDAKKVKWEIG